MMTTKEVVVWGALRNEIPKESQEWFRGSKIDQISVDTL